MSSDLTAAAITKIEELAVLASGSKSFSVTMEPGRSRIFDSKNGSLTYWPTPDLPPDITLSSLDDLEVAYEKYGDPGEGTVWVDETRIVLLFDSTRIGKASLRLNMNPAIEVLKNMRGKTPQQLRSILRLDLFDAKLEPEDFTQAISNLKFETTQTTDVKLAKGDESIGKGVRSKVTSEAEIPQTVSFGFRLYPDIPYLSHIAVACGVVTDSTAGTVSVIPYPGEIDLCIRSVMNRIAESLRAGDTDWTVFQGSCK